MVPIYWVPISWNRTVLKLDLCLFFFSFHLARVDFGARSLSRFREWGDGRPGLSVSARTPVEPWLAAAQRQARAMCLRSASSTSKPLLLGRCALWMHTLGQAARCVLARTRTRSHVKLSDCPGRPLRSRLHTRKKGGCARKAPRSELLRPMLSQRPQTRRPSRCSWRQVRAR